MQSSTRVGERMDRTNVIEETASDWLVRRDSGNWDSADQAALDAWLAASTEHRVTFLRLELAWEDSARLKALGAGIAGDLPPPPGHWNVDRVVIAPPAKPPAPQSAARRSWRWPIAAAAAACVLVMCGALLFGMRQAGERFTTPVGGLAKVPMADGSRITLNTASDVQVLLSKSQRHIQLQQGEAFFEVARDPERPFVVEANGRHIIAVGTQFSVRREGDFVEVVVTEGKVRMEEGARRGPGAAPVFLTAGYIAQSTNAELRIEQHSIEDAVSRLSWRAGVLQFRDLPLGDAVAEFNRYNTRKIVIADDAVAQLRIEGNFRPTQSQAFVRLLEAGFPVRASTDGDRIVLASK